MKDLAEKIQEQYRKIAEDFSSFQNKTDLNCRQHCGKCCFKPDIYVSPLEMLPLGLKLIAENRAEEILDKCLANLESYCVLLNVVDAEKGFAHCTEYEHRPFICRTFAVAARKDKYGKPEFSVCKIIKEDKEVQFDKLLKSEFSDNDIPYIDVWKKRLEVLDPRLLEGPQTFNKSLATMLEKLLFLESLKR